MFRTWQNKEFLIKTIKEGLGKPAIGVTYQMSGLSTRMEPFLKSEYLDIAVTQPLYQHRMPTLNANEYTPFISLRKHNKMKLEEFDFRSWIREIYNNEIATMKIGTPTSLEDFKNLHRKLAGLLLAEYQGWWYYDISVNAFNDPGIQEEIKSSMDIYRWVEKQKVVFRPDVCIVTCSSFDTLRTSIHRFRDPVSWVGSYMDWDIAAAGVPFDHVLIDDLVKDPGLAEYKVYFFMNAFSLTPEQEHFINERLKKDGKTVIWHYASGYVAANGNYSIDNVEKLTGMKTSTDFNMKNYRVETNPNGGDWIKDMLPLQGVGDVFRSHFTIGLNSGFLDVQRFVITDKDVVTLGTYVDDGSTAIAVKKFADWTSVYVASLGGLSAELFYNIAQKAGAYTLCKPGNVQVCMNGSFLSLHAQKTGTIDVKLPRKCSVEDAFTGQILGKNTNEIKLNMKAGESRWLLMK